MVQKITLCIKNLRSGNNTSIKANFYNKKEVTIKTCAYIILITSITIITALSIIWQGDNIVVLADLSDNSGENMSTNINSSHILVYQLQPTSIATRTRTIRIVTNTPKPTFVTATPTIQVLTNTPEPMFVTATPTIQVVTNTPTPTAQILATISAQLIEVQQDVDQLEAKHEAIESALVLQPHLSYGK